MTAVGFRGGNSDRLTRWVRSAVRCRRNQHGYDRTRVCCEFAVVCGERLGRPAAHPAHEAVPATAQHASHSTQHATQHAHVCCTARQSLGTGRVARRTTAPALLQRSLPYTLATHAAAGRDGRSSPFAIARRLLCCTALHLPAQRAAAGSSRGSTHQYPQGLRTVLGQYPQGRSTALARVAHRCG